MSSRSLQNLAWLSSTTHFTTLVVLQPYFKKRPFLRRVRITGILCNMVLLLYFTLVASTAASDNVDGSASIQCVLDNLSPMLRDARSDPRTWANVWFLLDSHWKAMSNIYEFRTKFWQSITWLYCRWFLSNTESLSESLALPDSNETDGASHKFQRKRKFVSWKHWYRCDDLHLTKEAFNDWRIFYFGPVERCFRWSPKWEARGRIKLRRKLGRRLALLQDYELSFFSTIPIAL